MVPSSNPKEPWAPIPVSISTPKFPVFNPISTTPPPQKPVPPPPTHQKPVIPAKSPDMMKPTKSPPPPPMSPKPVLEKGPGPVITAPKPSPLPTRRMKLPAPPMKPNFTPPLPPNAASQSSSPVTASPEPAVNSFQEMQAQLAKSFNASPIKAAKPVEIPAKPITPVKPVKPVKPSTPPPAVVSVDDLPPPPVDFLVAQPAITPKPAPPKPPQPLQPPQPQRVVETMGPKISDILKNMQPPVTEPKPPARFNSKPTPAKPIFEAGKKSLSLHTPSPPPHTANTNLIRSQTCPQIPPQQNSLVARMAQELAEKMVQKAPSSGEVPQQPSGEESQNTVSNLPPQHHNGTLSRANNVTQIEPRLDPQPPRQNSVGSLPMNNPPMPRSRTFGDLPIHQVNQFQQPNMRPPIAHFASPYIPPPNHDQLVRPEQVQMIMRPMLDQQIRPVMNHNMVLDHQIRPNHTNMRPDQLPGPQFAPRPMIRAQPPQSKCATPPLPSRKDSLLASQQRSRTISGSSGGSSIPALRSDNLRSSFDNLATRPPSPITTASPHNASSTLPYNTSNTIPYNTGTLPRGVPNMLQRNTSPYLHKPPVPTPWQQENLCRDWNQEQDQNNNTINVANQGQHIMGTQGYRMPTQRDSPQRARMPQHSSESNLPVRNMLRNNNSLRNGSPVVANHFIGSQGTIGSHGTHGYPPGNYNYPPSVMSNVSHTPSNGSSNSEEVITNTFRIVDCL